MGLARRLLVLVAVSVAGVGLLAPLAARSAAPVDVPASVEHLLPDVVLSMPLDLERGPLTDRAAVLAPDAGGAEALDGAPEPSRGAVSMEATLITIATPRPVAVALPQRVVTYDGDSVWDDLARCESGGNWAINTGNGYYGGLQFSYDTWHGYGGGEFADYPHEATREQQIIVAERLHAVRGFQPWPACRIKLGLP